MQTPVPLKRVVTLAALTMMVLMCLGMRIPAAHAQNLNAQHGTNPTHPFASSQTAFIAPQVSITCGGAIGSATDANGVPINWTFNTLQPGPVCVTVTYNVPPFFPNQICDFFFYVPAGDATGHLFFHFNNGNTVKRDENPVSGFTQLGDQVGVTQVSFTDVNDQPTNSFRLGWGKAANHGLEAVCGP